MSRAGVACVLLVSAAFLFTPPLEAFPWPSRVQQLEKLLRDESVPVRRAAARSLTELSRAQVRSLLELAWEDPDVEVRASAAHRALEVEFFELNVRALPWLKESSFELREAVLTLLSRECPPEAVPDVGRLLRAPERELRVRAAEVLGQVEPDRAAEAETLLLGALEDQEAWVRGAVVESLGRVGSARAALPLGNRLRDAESEVRVRAAVALGALGEASSERDLLLALQDADLAVRAAAARGLGSLGLVSSAPFLLAQAKKSPWSTAQEAAIEGLGRQGGTEAEEALVSLLEREEAHETLLPVLRARGPSLIPLLRSCQARAASHELRACSRLLLERGERPASLLQLASRSRLSALFVLETFQSLALEDEEATLFALSHLTHDGAPERRAALAFLSGKQEWRPAHFEPIREVLGSSILDPRERAQALGLLIRDPSKDAVLLARAALGSTEVELRKSAVRVLVSRDSKVDEVLGWARDPELGEEVARVLELSFPRDWSAPWLERSAQAGSRERRILRRALWGISGDLPPGQLELLQDRARASLGQERLEWLILLLRADPTGDVSLKETRSASKEERTLLVQAAVFLRRPHVVRALRDDPELEVRALALQGWGRIGSIEEESSASASLLRGNDGVLRLALASGRLQARLRQESRDIPLVKSLLTETAPPLRLLGWSASLLWPEATSLREATLALRRDPEIEVRRVAARWLHAEGSAEAARALRVCAAYEPEPEVGRICSNPSEQETFLSPGAGGSAELVQTVLRSGAAPAVSLPVLWVEASGLPVVAKTGAQGELFLPNAPVRLIATTF